MVQVLHHKRIETPETDGPQIFPQNQIRQTIIKELFKKGGSINLSRESQ
ncbi:hypothetical protein KJ575_00930 [Patescibacteria group bacterium]|nr:hypothetical protein [Patescibacteria group bacterium]